MRWTTTHGNRRIGWGLFVLGGLSLGLIGLGGCRTESAAESVTPHSPSGSGTSSTIAGSDADRAKALIDKQKQENNTERRPNAPAPLRPVDQPPRR